MTSAKQGRLVRFECDGGTCHANYEHVGGFSEGWSEAKDGGWIAVRTTLAWRHFCPACKRELGDD